MEYVETGKTISKPSHDPLAGLSPDHFSQEEESQWTKIHDFVNAVLAVAAAALFVGPMFF